MASTLKATKRKLDDAFQNLDAAVEQDAIQPPPLKKAHTLRSLYSTLAKYGVKSKETSRDSSNLPLNTKTPHLTAILSRVASKRKPVPQFTAPVPGTEYSPSSLTAFLSRLGTFKLATYANKSEAIDAVAASKCGWTNDGKDRLVCAVCHISWVLAGIDGMSRDAANTLVEKQKVSLVDMHKTGCPWKTRQCDPSIYRIPLQSPAKMTKDLLGNASALEPVLSDIATKHPLTDNQLVSLKTAISSLSDTTFTEEGEQSASTPAAEPSETALLVSLFGWTIVPERPRIPSRAGSVLRSVPPSPSISRASSVAPITLPSTPRKQISRSDSTPTVTPRRGTPSISRPMNLRLASDAGKQDAKLLHCTLCQRRVGLWAFAPPPPVDEADVSMTSPSSTPARAPPKQRQFDLLHEHRSYCPYVVKSTVVPSLPCNPPVPVAAAASSSRLFHSRSGSVVSISQWNGQTDAIEGWRAVLSIIARLGMGHRHYIARRTPSTSSALPVGTGNGPDADNAMVVDEDVSRVDAMVDDVKTRGGKDLLRYVKGLLGS